ncbi:MAG: Vitamin B12 transporter BtuB [Steroidobacteraceae bacterium]|nr:Vitamin B12 transporter BtuB [Steroidobacteraceae bacterium]
MTDSNWIEGRIEGDTLSYTRTGAMSKAALVFALVAAPVGAQTTPPADAPDTSPAARVVEEIIVTAQRREESAQDVPIAITAFSAERLEQQNITTTQDLQASVPSLVIGPNGQGARDTGTPTMRGLGATFQASPGVVMYLNEVPLLAPLTSSRQGGPGNFVDLENLQVLAGPQGTLFGRNTTGGAILLVPRKPSNEFSGSIQAGLGNHDNKEFEGVLNFPIIDEKLLVRMVGAYQDREGFTRDVVWDKDRDDRHWYSGRIGVTFRPTERLENYLMAYGSYSETNGTGIIHKGFNIDGPLGLGDSIGVGLCSMTPIDVSGDFSCDVYRAATNQANDLGDRKTAHGLDDFSEIETWGIDDTLSYEISDHLTLRNILSYQRLRNAYNQDQDGTVLQQYDGSRGAPYPGPGVVTLPGTGTPIVYANEARLARWWDNYRQATEELQLQGNFLDQNLIVTIGGFYFEQTPEGDRQGGGGLAYCPAGLTGTPIPGIPPVCIAVVTDGRVETKSKALYAQGVFDFGQVTPALESLRLTAGLRYTWDEISGFGQNYVLTGTEQVICSATGLVTADIDDCSFSDTLKTGEPTWTVGLDYRATGDLLLYAKASHGYKAGGFNPVSVFADTRTFEPEEVKSFEGGFKGDFHLGDMPARLNVNYYFMDFSNIQKLIGDYNPDTNSTGARIAPAKADIQGIELEAAIHPWEFLEIGGNFSWTDFEYTEYSLPSNGFLPDCSGQVLPAGTPNDLTCLKGQYVAPYIYSVHAVLDLPLMEDKGDLALFVNFSHTAAQHTSGTVLPPNEPREKLEAFGLLNASLDWKNIYQSGVDVGLFVTNATDKRYRISESGTFVGGSLLTSSSIYGEPRMFGARVRYHFGNR